MARENVGVTEILLNTLLLSVIGIAIIIVILRHERSLMERFFAWFYSDYANKYLIKGLAPFKKELFAKLSQQKSYDNELRKESAIRIVEIGPGPGVNFAFYPKNCRLVCYDPNPFFKSILLKRKKDFPHVNLERLIAAGAETLVGTDDESVDAVVATTVLCSVNNIDAVLKEIKRVLAPGGKFYFLEHVGSPAGTFTRYLQELVNPFWKTICVNCHLTRDLELPIREFGFSDVEIKQLKMPLPRGIIQTFMKEAIMGTASK